MRSELSLPTCEHINDSIHVFYNYYTTFALIINYLITISISTLYLWQIQKLQYAAYKQEYEKTRD